MIRVSALAMAVALVISIPASAQGPREVLSRVKPVYPELAKRLKIAGSVLLQATVGPSGTVSVVHSVMGESLLLEAAKQAVLRWKFAPSERESIEDVEVSFP